MKKIAFWVRSAAFTAVASLSFASAAEADVDAAPPAAFAVCLACHRTSPDGASSVGPNLRGVVGRKAGSQANYDYSAALKGVSFVWTADELDQWLAGPSKMVPGTKMSQPVPLPADREEIIKYLATLK